MLKEIFTKSLPVILLMVGGLASHASGQLETVCPDKTKEPCATAKKMIISTGAIVTGEELKGDEWTFTANKMLSSPEIGEEKFKNGLSFVDALNFWKSWLASPFTGDGNRLKVLNLAFMEVYGVFPLEVEKNVWMEKIKAKQAWYATIVSKEISGLNSAEVRRRAMIERVYNHAFGRPATDSDLKYWVPRTEHYRQVVDANRGWLYSLSGTTDLRFAARKALLVKYNKEPSNAEVDAAAKKFTPGKLIYIEMVKAA